MKEEFVRRQEQRAGGDLLGAAGTAQQIGRAAGAVGLLAVLEAAQDARGVDAAGRQRVGADAVGGMIDREALGELDQRRLAGGVGRAAGDADLAELRGDVDDGAAAGLADPLPQRHRLMAGSVSGLSATPSDLGFRFVIPPGLDHGHESHFPLVLDTFLDSLDQGEWPISLRARIHMRYTLLARARRLFVRGM